MFEPVRSEFEADVIPPPRHKFVNTMRGSCFSEISFDDLPLEFSQVKDEVSDGTLTYINVHVYIYLMILFLH
ncbi:hypothetical protein Hdeb2414_s0474g00901471 [Helianthus debilis subsp. tardiflorus]